MKKLLITLTVIFVSSLALAQTKAKNYVKSTSYQVPVQTQTEIDALPSLDKLESITYYDGLGRPEQSIALRQGSLGTIANELTYDWEEGNFSTPFFNLYGLSTENEIINGVTPFGLSLIHI